MCQLWFQALFLRAVKYDISVSPVRRTAKWDFQTGNWKDELSSCPYSQYSANTVPVRFCLFVFVSPPPYFDFLPCFPYPLPLSRSSEKKNLCIACAAQGRSAVT